MTHVKSVNRPAQSPPLCRLLCLLISFALGISACQQPPGVSEPVSGAVGGAAYEIRAWGDENRNGRWDAEERPLAGIEIELRVETGDYACYFDPSFCEAEHSLALEANREAADPFMLRMSQNNCDWGSMRWTPLGEPRFLLGRNGRGFVNVLFEGCGLDEIAAIPPAGYQPTTPQVQQVAAGDGVLATVSFGFKHEQ